MNDKTARAGVPRRQGAHRPRLPPTGCVVPLGQQDHRLHGVRHQKARIMWQFGLGYLPPCDGSAALIRQPDGASLK